jgi:excinuclease ABC subunit A
MKWFVDDLPDSLDTIKHLIVDRIVVNPSTSGEDEFYNRLADAVQTAFFEGKGICHLQN